MAYVYNIKLTQLINSKIAKLSIEDHKENC